MYKSIKIMSQLPRWAFWGLALPLLVLNGWVLLVIFHYFQSLITVFITANLLAFILNYPVEFLTSYGLNRNRVIFLVLILTVFLIILLGLTVAPALVGQLTDLLQKLPSWIESGKAQIQAFDFWADERKIPLNFSILASQLSQNLSEQLQLLAGRTLSLVLGTLDSVINILLVLVLTFYILLQGEQLWDGIIEWLPKPTGSTLRGLIRKTFHNYYVGQASMAAIVGVVMTVTFLLLKIPFALLFGLGLGFMALFPFGVPISIAVISSLTALKSVWLGTEVLMVSVVIHQILENGIAPRLIGGFTGLNPIWILLALLTGTQVAGVLGLLIAVPTAGFIKSAAIALREASAAKDVSENDSISQEDLTLVG